MKNLNYESFSNSNIEFRPLPVKKFEFLNKELMQFAKFYMDD